MDTVRERPVFSVGAGMYAEAVDLKIYATSGKVIFTRDGTVPMAGKAEEWKSVLKITKNTVIRARVVVKGKVAGPVVTASYFIGEKVSVPVFSIAVAPDSFFAPVGGIYAQYLDELETEAHFEFFEPGKGKVFEADAGFMVTGGESITLLKKSLRVSARKKYGSSVFDYSFFPGLDILPMKGFFLRADALLGTHHTKLAGERLRNELIYAFNKEMGNHVDIQAIRHVALYINGEYWGLYSLIERKNKDFIRTHYGFTDIDLMANEDLEIVSGNDSDFVSLLHFMNSTNLDLPENWERLNRWVDMENFTDYWVLNTFCGLFDYGVNVRWWRPRTAEGKWRWISIDNDSWDEPEHEFFTEMYDHTTARGVYMLGKMLRSERFKKIFLNRLSDCMNSVFLPENFSRLIVEIQSGIKEELERDRMRWEGLINYVPAGIEAINLLDYAKERPENLNVEIIDALNLSGTCKLSLNVEPQGAGSLFLNSIHPTKFPWTGSYFKGIELNLKALPEAGFVFDHWRGGVQSGENPIAFIPGDKEILTAVFRKSP